LHWSTGLKRIALRPSTRLEPAALAVLHWSTRLKRIALHPSTGLKRTASAVT
jgi:hypothetical protein